MAEENSSCAYGFDVVDELLDGNLTETDRLTWPCELRVFWVGLQPFVRFVRGLLHHGTILIIISGLVLNSISVAVLTKKHMRKQTSNTYLAVIAFYDCMTLLMNFMVGVLRGQHIGVNWDFQRSEHLCRFHGVIVELFNLLSVWMIVAFTIERFVLIKFPLKAKSMSPRRAIISIAVVSGTIFIFSMHKIWVSGFEGDSVYGYKACKTRRAIFPEIIYFYVAFNTWLPTFIITTLNASIIWVLYQSRRKRLTNSSSKEDKATKLLLTVSFTYVFLIVPLGFLQTVELIWKGYAEVLPKDPSYTLYKKTKLRLKWTRAFFFFFYQFNFIINFFLYVFSSSSTQFRPTLKKLLGMKVKNSELVTEVPTNSIAPS